MAPELFEGTAASAQSDQFALAAALFEALCGRKPFEGSSLQELQTSHRRPLSLSGLRAHHLPGPIAAAIGRALAFDPAARFKNMEDFARSISWSRVRRRKAAMVAMATVVLGTSAAFAAGHWLAQPASPCERAGDLAEVWTPSARASMRAAFDKVGRSDAADAYSWVDSELASVAASWRTMRQAACRDTRLSHIRSEQVLDARNRCLERKRDQFAALVTRLQEVDARGVDEYML